VRGGVSNRSGSGDSFDALLVTMHTVDFKVRIYRMDGSNGATTWTLIHTTAASPSAGARQCEFGIFKTTAGLTYYLVVIRTTSPSVSGLYTVAYVGGAGPPGGDGVVTRRQAYNGSLAVNQARILIGEGNTSKMFYSDIGDITFTGPAFLDIEPNQGSAVITSITPFAPDDLLIAKEGAPWVQISGDISSASTPVREMGDEYHGRNQEQHLARVPGGLLFVEPGGSVYVTDGRTFNNIGFPINRRPSTVGSVVGSGQATFFNNFAFVGSRVWSNETNGWAKLPETGTFWSTDYYQGHVWGLSAGTNFIVRKYEMFDGDGNTNRFDTYTWQSAPFSDPNGRNVEIREVQVFGVPFAASSITVELLDRTGASVVTRTVTMSSKGMYQFLFPNTKSEYLSVKITAAANSSSNEAPVIERVRIGFGPNNLIS
jgi:hypothetical protein